MSLGTIASAMMAGLLSALVVSPAHAQSSICGEWEVMSTPIPPVGSMGSSQFRDVVAISPDDVWAVGEIHVGAPSWETHSLAMHFDGTEWTIVPTPNPSTSINALETVAAVSTDDVWAAGVKEIFNPFRELRPFIIHWDGSTWEEVVDSELDVWGAPIWGIEVGGPNDIWFGADGPNTFHWDGSSFEHRPVPTFDTGNCSGTSGCGHAVEDLAVVAPDDVWAVGGAGDGDYSYVSQIWHWDGTEWAHTPGPSISYWQRLNGVVALAPDDVWAVGDLDPADPTDNGMLIIHWNGAEWTRVDTPLYMQPSGDLQDIFAIAPDDIWASGIYTETPLPAVGLPLTMHYDGTDWRQVMPDPDGPAGAWLRGISAGASCDLWSVGSSLEKPFVQRLTPGFPAEVQVSPPAVEMTVAPGGTVTSPLLIENLSDPTSGPILDWSLTKVIPPPVSAYTAITSDEVGGPTFEWNDISAIGTPMTLFNDWYQGVDLPFTIWFYGEAKTQMMISSNGYLTFGGYGYAHLNHPFPDATVPNDMIAVFWDDLYPQHPINPGTAHYYHDTLANEFVVQYTNVPRVDGASSLSFQVILRPSGEILFQYQSMEGELTSATIGIENATGTAGLQLAYNEPFVHDGLAVLFPALGTDWLSFTPESGALSPSSSETVEAGSRCDEPRGGNLHGHLDRVVERPGRARHPDSRDADRHRRRGSRAGDGARGLPPRAGAAEPVPGVHPTVVHARPGGEGPTRHLRRRGARGGDARRFGAARRSPLVHVGRNGWTGPIGRPGHVLPSTHERGADGSGALGPAPVTGASGTRHSHRSSKGFRRQ